MRIYTVAILASRECEQQIVYVGDAILHNDEAWLVLEWDSEDKNHAIEKLPLDPHRLMTTPPDDLDLAVDWHYIIHAGPVN